MTRSLSGNYDAWLGTVAKEIREAGSPVSLDFLARVVPSQFATARNDGHVTAAENGLDRNDFVAGQRIWVEEAVAALVNAKLVAANGDGYRWTASQDGNWTVPFGKWQPKVFGRAERAAARDRHMLGRGGSPGYLLKGMSEVDVEVEKGAKDVDKGRHTFEVHPLAFAIPPMTETEQMAVREDIEKHGVRQPLVLYPDKTDKTARGKPKKKVLDGRHRLQFASALGVPVRVEVFEGTEREARELVASLNLHRRQLTVQQRAQAIVRLFGEESKVEARADRVRKPAGSVPRDSSEQTNGKSEGGEWHERAWKKAGGEASGVTKDAVKAMGVVDHAPRTAARVESGEIRSTERAVREAKAEIAGTPTKQKVGGNVVTDKTRSTHISNALYELRRAAQVSNPGKQTPMERNAKLAEIKRLAEELRS